MAHIRPLAVLRLAVRFVWASVVAGLDIARRAFSPSLPLKLGYLNYPVGLPPGTSRNLFTSVTSLMPGTLPAGTDESGRLIYHCLDVEQPVLQELGQEEAQLVAALGGARAAADAAGRATSAGARHMNPEFLVAVAGFVMITVVVGLARILWGPGDADRVMAAQLLGTGGIATLLLVSVARDLPAAVDVALTLAMLAAFASIAFVKGVTAAQDEDSGEGGGR